MKARRRLRRLVPDAELIRRCAGGVPLRELAADYGVVHTTLGRYFARPEVKRELAQARRQLRAEEGALVSAWRRLEREVRRRAGEQAAVERERQERFQVAWAEHESRRRPPRDQYEALLNEHDAPWLPLTRAELHSQLDETAKRVVAAGGGTQAVIDATDLRTLEQVAHLIDPAILIQAFDNDALPPQPPPLARTRRPRPRRLIADAALIQRRAAGEPLRQLAYDYHVAHTTLSRYFARTEITRQLQHTRRQLRAQQRARDAVRHSDQRPPHSKHAAKPHS